MSSGPIDEPTEAPATWENILVGKAKEVVGDLVHDRDLAEQGEAQEQIAREVHEEYEEHEDRPDRAQGAGPNRD